MDGTTNNRELLGTKIPLATCKELCLEDSSCNGIEFWYRSFDCYKCIDPSRHYPHEFKSWREPNPIVVEKGSSGYEGNVIQCIKIILYQAYLNGIIILSLTHKY